MASLRIRLDALDAAVHRWLVAYSVTLLRVSVGVVFLGFGVLKYFPGVSPAEAIAKATTEKLTFGLAPSGVTLVVVATLECLIGLSLISGRWLRIAVYLLALEFVGILSPIFLFTSRLFAGPHHAPTLEGQYVLKDIVLVGAGMVVASTLRGGKLVPGSGSAKPTARPGEGDERFTAHEKLEIVLDGIRKERPVRSICREHGIDESDYRRWRDEMLDGAIATMTSSEQPTGDHTLQRRIDELEREQT